MQAARDHPVDDNAGGSYLTMRSKEGAIFFVINIVGNFGTVFLDNGKLFETLFTLMDQNRILIVVMWVID